MNILITGGTGFIGSALCSRLLEGKHNIVLLSQVNLLLINGGAINKNNIFSVAVLILHRRLFIT
jgi:nucleoside-diphosphate-sugar epimerase